MFAVGIWGFSREDPAYYAACYTLLLTANNLNTALIPMLSFLIILSSKNKFTDAHFHKRRIMTA